MKQIHNKTVDNPNFFEPSTFGLKSDKQIIIGQPILFSDFGLNINDLSIVSIDQILDILTLVPHDIQDSVVHSLKYDFKFYLLPIDKNSKSVGIIDTKLSKKAIQFLLKNSSSKIKFSDIFIESYVPKNNDFFYFLSFIKELELHKFFKKTFFNIFKLIFIKIFILLLIIIVPSLKQFLPLF